MGENREGARRRGDDSKRDGEGAGDKILDFGRGLWKKGSKAVEGAVDKLKDTSPEELARQAKKLGNQAGEILQGPNERQLRNLGGQAREMAEGSRDNERQARGTRGRMDQQSAEPQRALEQQGREQGRNLEQQGRGLLERAKDLAGGLTGGADLKGLNLKDVDVSKIAGVAGVMAFPQLEILNRGSKEMSGLLSRKQAKMMLEDPQSLGDKMVVNFDMFDKDNTGYLTKEKLAHKSTLLGIGDDQATLGYLMTAGFTPLNKLDGDESKNGISRQDVQTFKLLYDKDALSTHISSEARSSGMWSAAIGGLGGGGGAYLMRNALGGGAGRIGLIAAGSAAVIGGIGYIWSRSSQSSDFEAKRTEMDAMIKSMKSAF